MVLKRHICEEGAGSGASIRESKRRISFPGLARDVLRAHTLNEFMSEVETLVRRVVREEVEPAILRTLHSSSRSSSNHIEASGTRAWQLHFDNKLPSTLFTSSRIESENRTPIKILILDATTKKIVASGPLSSIKIEICVVNGDFGTDDQEEWTKKEFSANVVHQREGKRPLLHGDRVITFRDGVGYMGEISFTDNSSWIRSRRFRLAAAVLETTCPELRVREAISEAFVVKDHRGESYKKHYPPYLGDEIWRLEKIAKDGVFHQRLADNRIYTVQDFLRLYITDPVALRSVFGGIPNKAWETITEHAVTCKLDNTEFYLYYRAAERVGIVLNSIYKVVVATFDGHNFQSLDNLTFIQTQLVKELKLHAYKNLNDLVPIDDQSILAVSSLQADPFGIGALNLQQGYLPIKEQSESEVQTSFNHPEALPYPFEVKDNNQFEVSIAQNIHPMRSFSPTLRNSFIIRNFCSGSYGGGNCWTASGSLVPGVQPSHLASDVTYTAETSTWVPVTTMWDEKIGSEVGITSFPDFGICIGNRKAGWCKLRAAVKLGISVRRDVAAKRIAELMYLDI